MNLSALRRFRRHVEDGLKVQLAALNASLHAALDRARRHDNALHHARAQYEAAMAGGLTASEAEEHYRNLDRCAAMIERATQEAAVAQAQWDVKRSELVEAARETRKVDMLTTRRAARERARVNHREQKLLDEASHLRYLRAKGQP